MDDGGLDDAGADGEASFREDAWSSAVAVDVGSRGVGPGTRGVPVMGSAVGTIGMPDEHPDILSQTGPI